MYSTKLSPDGWYAGIILRVRRPCSSDLGRACRIRRAVQNLKKPQKQKNRALAFVDTYIHWCVCVYMDIMYVCRRVRANRPRYERRFSTAAADETKKNLGPKKNSK